MHLLAAHGELAVAVNGDNEVDRELRIQLRVVRAVVRPARLPPLDRPEEGRLRSDQRAAQVEGVRQVAVALRGGADVDGLCGFLYLGDLLQSLPEALLAAHDAAAFRHRVAQGALELPGKYFAFADVAIQLLLGLPDRLAGVQLRFGGPRERRGRLPGPPPEDHRLG